LAVGTIAPSATCPNLRMVRSGSEFNVGRAKRKSAHRAIAEAWFREEEVHLRSPNDLGILSLKNNLSQNDVALTRNGRRRGEIH
jgi:hypothetical protein